MKQAMIAQSTRPANRFWRDRWEPINGNSFGIRLSRLAWMIEWLFPPCRRNPLAYHERKSEIVSELKALAALAVGELKDPAPPSGANSDRADPGTQPRAVQRQESCNGRRGQAAAKNVLGRTPMINYDTVNASWPEGPDK